MIMEKLGFLSVWIIFFYDSLKVKILINIIFALNWEIHNLI